MLGAIVGDITGSVYEFANTKSTEFDLFTPRGTGDWYEVNPKVWTD